MSSASLVSDLEDQPAALPGTARSNDRAERTGDPPLAPDHLADIVLGDVQPEHDRVVVLLLLDADGVRLVNEAARQVGQELSQGS
jgi:hypothetical protein